MAREQNCDFYHKNYELVANVRRNYERPNTYIIYSIYFNYLIICYKSSLRRCLFWDVCWRYNCDSKLNSKDVISNVIIIILRLSSHRYRWLLVLLVPNYLWIIWLSYILILSLPDEGCSRNASCVLHSRFTLLFELQFYVYTLNYFLKYI